VVNIASMLGDLVFSEAHPEFNFASYAVTKAGLTMANLKFHHECVANFILTRSKMGKLTWI
jgi:hypothetical protein